MAAEEHIDSRDKKQATSTAGEEETVDNKSIVQTTFHNFLSDFIMKVVPDFSTQMVSCSSLQQLMSLAIIFPTRNTYRYPEGHQLLPYLLCVRCACSKSLCVSSCE